MLVNCLFLSFFTPSFTLSINILIFSFCWLLSLELLYTLDSTLGSSGETRKVDDWLGIVNSWIAMMVLIEIIGCIWNAFKLSKQIINTLHNTFTLSNRSDNTKLFDHCLPKFDILSKPFTSCYKARLIMFWPCIAYIGLRHAKPHTTRVCGKFLTI